MNKDETSLPDFSGKCISLRLKSSEHSHDLDNPYFEIQGNKLFLLGTIPSGSSASGWDTGQLGAIEWQDVRSYILFDSLEEYSKAIAISDAYEEQSLAND